MQVPIWIQAKGEKITERRYHLDGWHRLASRYIFVCSYSILRVQSRAISHAAQVAAPVSFSTLVSITTANLPAQLTSRKRLYPQRRSVGRSHTRSRPARFRREHQLGYRFRWPRRVSPARGLQI